MSLIRKFADYAAGSMISLLISLITTPIITRLYLPEEMGKYSLFLAVMGLVMTIAELGTEQAYLRFYNEEKKENRAQLWYICCGIPLVFFSVISCLCLAFYKEITVYLSGEVSGLFYIFVVIYGVVYIISRFGMFLSRMQQKAKLFSLYNIIIKIAYVVGAITWAKVCKPTYLMLIISISASYLIVAVLSITFERNNLKLVNRTHKLDNSLKTIFRYCIPFVFSQIIFWVFSATDKMMIRQLSTYEQIGIYAGAMSIVNIVVTVQTAFATFWTPVAYERYKKNPQDKKFFEDINIIVTVSMILVALIVVLFKDMFSILLGTAYAESIDVFPFLIYMPIMATVSETTVMGINFRKKSEWHIVISLFSAVVNFGLNSFMITVWGAKGAAIATGISYCFYYYVRTIVANRFYRCNFHMVRFSVVILFTYATSIYASFHKTNSVTVCFVLLTLIVLALVYARLLRNVIKNILKRKGAKE